MVINGKCYFLVSTKFKHVYFPCDGNLFLLKLVEMLSGNTYFRCIGIYFSTIYLIFYSKSPFSMVKVSLNGNTLYLRLLTMKGFDAIRSGYDCFISMTISVESLCGF